MNTTSSIIFGRRPQFDERSRGYPVRSLLTGMDRKPRSYTWRCREYHDQGSEGACVGFSWMHELAARPAEVPGTSPDWAMKVYRLAQRLDPWPGENYDGTSVLAGVKALQDLHPGKIAEYRWAFGLTDVLRTVSYLGPVVLGINWLEGMVAPSFSTGLIRATGSVLGGHAILCNGINTKDKTVRLHNSWGEEWGAGGDAFLPWDDLDMLLKDGGEACVAVRRAPEKRRR